ncbi:MAG: PspC domain-containing protein [Candidatus Zixiibacteriota bacterium]
MAKRMYLSNRSKVFAGVAGGLGEYFDIDPVLIRIAFVVLVFLHGFGLLAYIVAWIAMPRVPANEVVVEPVTGPEPSPLRKYLPGIALVMIGLVFLLERTLDWFEWQYIWPILIIVAGLALVAGAISGRESKSGGVNESVEN